MPIPSSSTNPILIAGSRNDQDIKPIEVDPSTRGLIVMPNEHHQLHEGNSYVVSDVQSVATATKQWMLTTPNTDVEIRINFDVDCTGEMLFTLKEGADRTGTTALTPINRRRSSSNTSTLVVHRDVSGGTTDGATTIQSRRVGSTNQGGQTLSPGGHRGENEYHLKKNTKYVISVQTFASVFVTLHLDWYEQVDKT